MQKLSLKAYAKLNLYLHVLPKKAGDRLHQLRSINCQLNLADELTVESQSRKIEVSCQFGQVCSCSKKDLCRGQKNLIIRAAELIKEQYGRPELGAEIFVEKKIPPSSGLAGGSADAAAVLRELSKMWGVGKLRDLRELTKKLGSDVSYCFEGGLCEVAGTGEKVKKLGYKMPEFPVVVVLPEIEKPSTAWAYSQLDKTKNDKSLKKLKLLKQAIKRQDFEGICQNLHNDFEAIMVEKFPVVGVIRQKLLKYGASGAILAGSGLAVCGFFKTKDMAETAHQKLKKEYKKVYLSQILQGSTLRRGKVEP